LRPGTVEHPDPPEPISERASARLRLVAQTDRRAITRRRLYVGDGLGVRIHRDDGAPLVGEVIDLSPHGMGIALATDLANAPAVGDAVVMEYAPRHAPAVTLHAEVAHAVGARIVGRPMVRLGLAVLPSPSSTHLRVADRRAHARFACADTMPLAASAPSPVFFGETLYFQVRDISARGLTLTTSLRNKEIVKGLALALRVVVPLLGELHAAATVTSVRHVGDRFRVGVRFREPQSALSAALAEYVLMTSPMATPHALRAAGFALASMECAVAWDYATSRADYERILHLRLEAHRHEGRWQDRTPADMASPFDVHARHIVGRVAGRIVACGRVAFVEGRPERSEYVTRGGHVVPDWLWTAGFCESGANAVDPAFQRTDLYLGLLRHAVRVTVQAGRRYVLGASPPALVHTYLKLGCTVLEERDVNPVPSWRFRSTLMVIDVDRLAREVGGGVFAPVLEFLSPS
jgi:hypothetical protein